MNFLAVYQVVFYRNQVKKLLIELEDITIIINSIFYDVFLRISDIKYIKIHAILLQRIACFKLFFSFLHM